ncbi:MAG: hypothetical protein QOJ99_1879, partial [Bryobacterales bacterium]|nr:hypothetical protein [Bryobacterales bacterium]
ARRLYTRTCPQHCPPQVVRVPLDPGVEEVDDGLLGLHEIVGVVEVLPGLGDRAFGVVVFVYQVAASQIQLSLNLRHFAERSAPF